MPATITFKLRRSTAATWASVNPVLAAGEPGLESDTGKMKLGDGTTAWNSLAYAYTINSIPGSLELIYKYTVTGADKASIDTGVDTPQAGSNDWTNGDLLEIFIYARGDDTGYCNLNTRVNNDSSAIYDLQSVAVINGTVSGGTVRADTKWLFQMPGVGFLAGVFGTFSLRIPNYLGTVGNKHGECIESIVDSTAANCEQRSFAMGYRSTTALSRLAIFADSTKNFKVGTQLLIYKRVAAGSAGAIDGGTP